MSSQRVLSYKLPARMAQYYDLVECLRACYRYAEAVGVITRLAENNVVSLTVALVELERLHAQYMGDCVRAESLEATR